MSPILREFLETYVDFVRKDDPEDNTFMKGQGLCLNLKVWMGLKITPSSKAVYEKEFLDILRKDFGEGMNFLYPFGGRVVYFHERNNQTAYKNPLRLNWVLAKLAEEE